MNTYRGLIVTLAFTGFMCASSAVSATQDEISTDMKTLSGPAPIILMTPRYPDDFIEKNLSGRVEMAFTIDSDGKPTDIRVVNDANAELAQEPVHTLTRNMYSPAYAGQKVVVEAEFHLPSRSK